MLIRSVFIATTGDNWFGALSVVGTIIQISKHFL